jgi:hypothetical protein
MHMISAGGRVAPPARAAPRGFSACHMTNNMAHREHLLVFHSPIPTKGLDDFCEFMKTFFRTLLHRTKVQLNFK